MCLWLSLSLIKSNDATRYELFLNVTTQSLASPVVIAISIWQIYKRFNNAAYATLACISVIALATIWGG